MLPEDALERADECINTVRELLEQARAVLADPEIETKARQLRELERSVRRMEDARIPVPDELRHVRIDLAAATGRADEAAEFLSHVRAELGALLPMLGLKVASKSPSGATERTRLAPGELTPRSVLRKAIVRALEEMGGSGQVKDVLGRVYEILKDQWTPHDLTATDSGFVRWKNRVQWERLNMVKEGLLRDDSPRGIWELAQMREQ